VVNNAVIGYAYRLDRSKPLPEIDLINSDGMVSQGIYACSGDRLVWAERWQSDGPRPTRFTSEAGSNVTLWTLRRVKK
jgi:hypothetical protein